MDQNFKHTTCSLKLKLVSKLIERDSLLTEKIKEK
jgi:hypothetical protein